MAFYSCNASLSWVPWGHCEFICKICTWCTQLKKQQYIKIVLPSGFFSETCIFFVKSFSKAQFISTQKNMSYEMPCCINFVLNLMLNSAVRWTLVPFSNYESHRNRTIRQTSSRNIGVSNPKTETLKRVPTSKGAFLWNGIPNDLRTAKTKKAQKTALWNQ